MADNKMVQRTVFLPPVVDELLRDLAHYLRCSKNSLIRAGIMAFLGSQSNPLIDDVQTLLSERQDLRTRADEALRALGS